MYDVGKRRAYIAFIAHYVWLLGEIGLFITRDWRGVKKGGFMIHCMVQFISVRAVLTSNS
jgi:hypothetical protein